MPTSRPLGKTGEFIRTDVAFHYELARIARNPVFNVVHEILVEWLIDQRTTTIHMPDADMLSVRDHTAIYEAVAAREPARAFHEMASHLRLISRLYSEAKRLSETILREITRDVAKRIEQENEALWAASFGGARPAMAAPPRQRRNGTRQHAQAAEQIVTAAHDARQRCPGRRCCRRSGPALMATGTTVVLGAGAVGTASAWYLLKAGHRVEVVERQPAAGLETSWGNGGVIHASEVEPWSQPGMPRKILGWLGKEDAPLLLRYGAIPQMWRWGLAFAAQLHAGAVPRQHAGQSRARAAFAALAAGDRGRDRHRLRSRRPTASLKIYRSRDSLDAATRGCEILAGHGLLFERARRRAAASRASRRWPTTGPSLAGGLYFPRDEVGDCNKFTQGLAAACAAAGATLSLRHRRAAARDRRRPRHGRRHRQGPDRRRPRRRRAGQLHRAAAARRRRRRADLSGEGRVDHLPARRLEHGAAHAGDRRQQAVRPGADRRPACASRARPRSPATTPRRPKRACEAIVANAALDVSGTAAPLRPQGRAVLGRAAAGDARRARRSSGRTGIDGLWVNAGHGHLGWTLACGSGRVLADLVEGRDPGIAAAARPGRRRGSRRLSAA